METAFDKPRGFVGRREAAALRLSQLGDVAQFRFDVRAVGPCEFHHAPCRGDVLLERAFAGVDHHRVEAGVEAPRDEFDRPAVIEVNPPLDAVVGDRTTAHGDGLFEAHVVNRAARELQQHGGLHPLCGLHDGRKGLEIIEVGRQHGCSLVPAFVQ